MTKWEIYVNVNNALDKRQYFLGGSDIMRDAEKKEFAAEALINEVVRKAKKNFGEKNVKEDVDKVNGTVVITISTEHAKVTRREHRFPEHMRKEGD